MDGEQARARFRGERVARLATASRDGTPHLVPVTFAVAGDRVVIAIDHKPKTTTALRRLRNIRENPHVSLLADHYEDDWAQLWWVRADGLARVVEEGPEREPAIDALAAKYGQYREHRPAGPVIVVDVTRWSGWSFTP
ncbi:TIGR03668 family PPOX class F420-dependent oxidoreductase [Nonomuraea phyllanthi]|uniref:TIGR03668 family PPOX class F420-dependent oxidoreductase n=1 Tax=Nonomuraea phyllanthi TaxID=2219224 RepID=A0A5C4V807_9ACTN|nr:TIGR03668 family PPOX class F420-dependent oxidoreductase [Nonomuraea phyllanthi]KAB8187548.1 TIGR03668 family PPOX class F420-dependent oxidoreductase [Nonomuraea phyllanthi]